MHLIRLGLVNPNLYLGPHFVSFYELMLVKFCRQLIYSEQNSCNFILFSIQFNSLADDLMRLVCLALWYLRFTYCINDEVAEA